MIATPPARCVARLIVSVAALGAIAAPVLADDQDRAERVRAEGQHIPDQGDGTYRNPILPGRYPDPSIVRVQSDYYMVHSGRGAPGLPIWHSRDLVNWRPVGRALQNYVGEIWAPEIVFEDGVFLIYFPNPDRTNYVVTATDPAGPWSDPIDLKVGRIDPGHARDVDGQRVLHLSAGMAIGLTPDGLATRGEARQVYDGWDYPDDWVVECWCLESPKLFRRGEFFYMVTAMGGTAGPSTSHMAVVARAPSAWGPWENSPHNPLIRTTERDEPFWSQGHATLIDDVEGNWWAVYHAYENGYRTLGRGTLLLPVEWTDDGWPVIPEGVDPGDNLPMPPGENVGHGLELSDDFADETLSLQWIHLNDAVNDGHFVPGDGALRVRALGSAIADASILSMLPVNKAYEVQVEARVPDTASAGVLLFYDRERFSGVEMGEGEARTYWRSRLHTGVPWSRDRIFFKVRNDRHDVSVFHSADGETWTPFDKGFEVSGYHHNVLSGFRTLSVALFAAGEGEVEFRDFRYRGLDD